MDTPEYPTCQGGMNWPSHQRSPLIMLVEIVQRHKQDSVERASNTVTTGGGGVFQSISSYGFSHTSKSFHMWSLCDMV